MDDFYLISSGLAVTETSLFLYDQILLNHVRTEDAVMEAVRASVANRLAESGSEWAEIFSRHNRNVLKLLF